MRIRTLLPIALLAAGALAQDVRFNFSHSTAAVLEIVEPLGLHEAIANSAKIEPTVTELVNEQRARVEVGVLQSGFRAGYADNAGRRILEYGHRTPYQTAQRDR